MRWAKIGRGILGNPIRDDPYSKTATIFLLLLISFSFLVIFILYPIAVGAYYSLTAGGIGYYGKFLAEALYREALLNTFLITVVSTPLTVAVGLFYAVCLEAISPRFKKIFTYPLVLQLISPPFVSGLAFIMLFGRNGVISRFLEDRFGVTLDLYGLPGLVIVQVLTFFPSAFLIIYGALKNMDRSLEYAAQVLGASSIRTFFDIKLKLLKPAILSATLLIAMEVFADFGNPLLIGGRFIVLATLAYTLVVGWGDLIGALTVAYVLLIPSLALFFMQWKLIGRGRYVTISREAVFIPTRYSIRNRILSYLFLSLFSGIIYAFYALIFTGGFIKTIGVDYSFTLRHIEEVSLAARITLTNSLLLSISSSLLIVAISFITAYLAATRRIFVNKALEVLSTIPTAIPGTTFGLSYLLAFGRAPLRLYGTPNIIMFNNAARFIPLGFQAIKSQLLQIDPAIEESSIVLGAGVARTMFRIYLPLSIISFGASLGYGFINSMKTVSSVIFLQTPDWRLAAPFILGLGHHGYWGQACALSTILILIIIAFFMSLKLLFRGRVKLFGDLI
ncbi:MAG: iron ABC transporter permease [Ignisphaera sp.]